MFNEQILIQLRILCLDGMVVVFSDYVISCVVVELCFEECLVLLVQCEIDWCDDKWLIWLFKVVWLKVSVVCIEDINWCVLCGLDCYLIMVLVGCDWVCYVCMIFIIGVMGIGKMWLLCVLVQQVVCNGFMVLYMCIMWLLQELCVVYGDGSFSCWLV